MARMDMFMMDQEDRKRLHVINKVIEGEMTQVEAGIAIEITDRQIRRMVKRVGWKETRGSAIRAVESDRIDEEMKRQRRRS